MNLRNLNLRKEEIWSPSLSSGTMAIEDPKIISWPQFQDLTPSFTVTHTHVFHFEVAPIIINEMQYSR